MNDLFSKITLLLKKEAERNVNLSAKCDKKDKKCKVEICNRKVYCKELCHGHYYRFKNNINIDTPIRSRKRNNICIDCGLETDGKGGWDRCGNCYRIRKFNLIKNILIEHFGNKCNRCKNTYDSCIYDFHHKYENKEYSISYGISNISIKKLLQEIEKCELLCSNCHRIIHKEILNG
jgi:hypothetical protein